MQYCGHVHSLIPFVISLQYLHYVSAMNKECLKRNDLAQKVWCCAQLFREIDFDSRYRYLLDAPGEFTKDTSSGTPSTTEANSGSTGPKPTHGHAGSSHALETPSSDITEAEKPRYTVQDLKKDFKDAFSKHPDGPQTLSAFKNIARETYDSLPQFHATHKDYDEYFGLRTSVVSLMMEVSW